jgi:hypothetical protein
MVATSSARSGVAARTAPWAASTRAAGGMAWQAARRVSSRAERDGRRRGRERIEGTHPNPTPGSEGRSGARPGPEVPQSNRTHQWQVQSAG